jgi:Rrf2 family transcriptional regulator, cysteine metabolism repressor
VIFSTKAEYGVRLMIELARHEGEGPVSLGAVAESEQLPRSYLERLAAKLKAARLIASTHGARGGYHLAHPADEITMDDVVTALEGQIMPMECFAEGGVSRVSCSHEEDPRSCATKMLWARVEHSVQQALRATTLAELVEFGCTADAAEALVVQAT